MDNILDKFPVKIVKYLLSIGMEITICADENKVPYLNLNTGMKSHLHLYYKDGCYYAHTRYNHIFKLQRWADLHYCFVSCECGKGFMNSNNVDFYNKGFDDDIAWEEAK